MRHIQSLLVLLAIGAALSLAACSGDTTTSQLCFSQVPVTNVQSAGNNVNFTVTTVGKVSTFSVQKDAFGGAPATMKIGDSVSFCANQVEANGHVTITLNQFTVSAQPRPTDAP